MNNAKFIDETGNKYGKLTVIKREQNTPRGTAKWLCQCECGNTKECRGQDLRSGRITHCGCEKEPKRITNYFKIKNMSIDEMAEYLTNNHLRLELAAIERFNLKKPTKKKYNDVFKYATKEYKQYLLQEVEE